MKKRMLKKSDVLREGYIKGLKEAQRIINESIGSGKNPFIKRRAWKQLDEEEQEMVNAYLEVFKPEKTLQDTIEKAEQCYRGTFDSWAEWAQYEYEENEVIDGDMLVNNGCVDWNRAGEVFRGTDYRMAQNGMVFLED